MIPIGSQILSHSFSSHFDQMPNNNVYLTFWPVKGLDGIFIDFQGKLNDDKGISCQIVFWWKLLDLTTG